MTTFTVQAIYRDGVLLPATELDLPNNTAVQVQVTTQAPTTEPGSLFGAFPELAALTDADLEWVSGLWDRSSRRRTTELGQSE
jgi:hypothetical protein